MTPPKVTAVTNLNMESEAFANTKPVTWRYTPVQYYTKAFTFDKWARLASLSGDTLQVQQFLLRNLHIGSRLSSGKKVLELRDEDTSTIEGFIETFMPERCHKSAG